MGMAPYLRIHIALYPQLFNISIYSCSIIPSKLGVRVSFLF